MDRSWRPWPLVVVMVLHLLLVVLGLAIAADESQLVKKLPGYSSYPQLPPGYKQYAGQITVNATHGRHLFYWFYPAAAPNAASLPLVLWLNGGPGCSSVGNGALSELGPFFPDANNKLVFNNFTWIKAANIIFLESPAGTGFSYSDTHSDYSLFQDGAIAEDNHAFLVGWLKKFPEYSKNEFFIAGESYAGHYIPTLAKVILRENKSPTGFHINFKGFAVGNPWSDAYSDNLGTTEFYYSHSLISDETYKALKHNCDFQNDLPIDENSSNVKCSAATHTTNVVLSKIDIYNIYGASCNKESGNSSQYKRLQKPYLFTGAYVDPCLDGVTPYLNLVDVQNALNVKHNVFWRGCSDFIYENYSKVDFLQSMIPVYKELLQEDIRIWIYSGDVDGVVSTLGTRRWIKQLKLPIEIPWYAWDYMNQVGGWTQKYKGLTFATVREAGHLVPATQPKRALALFQSFLSGQPLPSF